MFMTKASGFLNPNALTSALLLCFGNSGLIWSVVACA